MMFISPCKRQREFETQALTHCSAVNAQLGRRKDMAREIWNADLLLFVQGEWGGKWLNTCDISIPYSRWLILIVIFNIWLVVSNMFYLSISYMG